MIFKWTQFKLIIEYVHFYIYIRVIILLYLKIIITSNTIDNTAGYRMTYFFP